jgi:hypothetical protein
MDTEGRIVVLLSGENWASAQAFRVCYGDETTAEAVWFAESSELDIRPGCEKLLLGGTGVIA